ncbi:hypothetical protein D3C75_811830 [compost metagenome]
MIQILDVGAEHPERLLGVFLARHLLQLGRHPIKEAIQLPPALDGVLDLLQECLALAIAVDQLFAQVDIDRVRLFLEPDLLLEIDAKALGVVLDLLDLAPVNQPLVVLQVFDFLEKRPVGRGVLANLQRHALEQILVVEVRHETLHRMGEDAGLVRGRFSARLLDIACHRRRQRLIPHPVHRDLRAGRLTHIFTPSQ